MEKTQKLEAAWWWARNARLAALRQKREEHGDPHNPLRALPGHEAEFEAATELAQSMGVILGALEREIARARVEAVKRKALRLRASGWRRWPRWASPPCLSRSEPQTPSPRRRRSSAPASRWAGHSKSPGSSSKTHIAERRTAMKSSNTLTPFGKLVVKALVDQDMTKTELAGQIGTSPQHLSRILHGTRPGGKHIPAIVAALALDPRKVEKAMAA